MKTSVQYIQYAPKISKVGESRFADIPGDSFWIVSNNIKLIVQDSSWVKARRLRCISYLLLSSIPSNSLHLHPSLYALYTACFILPLF